MKRISIAERQGWKEKAEHLGFNFHTIDNEPYWDESAYYQLTLAQVENDLEEPTREIHAMCLDLVDRVVESEELLGKLAIPPQFYDLIRTSWREGHPHLYGRMDFSYNGTGPAKMLELNYDTPTSIYEGGAFQWIWLEDCIKSGAISKNADQFNSIDQKLKLAFQQLAIEKPFYFASIKGSMEDKGTTDYLRDIAEQCGIKTHHIDVEDIGLTADGRFVDLQNNWIPHLFKLHAWEFIFREPFGAAVPGCDTQFIEPAWKAILSNKGVLPLLWEMNKGHPNLLPTFVDTDLSKPVAPGWVRKPYFSREGSNIDLCTSAGELVRVDGPYTDAPFIRQEFTLCGSWVIADEPAGIGFREDNSLITKDSSRFLPHIILD